MSSSHRRAETTRALSGRSRPWRRRTGSSGAALLLLLLLGLSACAGSDSSGDASDSAMDTAAAGDADSAESAQDDAAVQEDGGADEASDAVDVIAQGPGGRQVVTATIDVAVTDVPDAARDVRVQAASVGGFVAGESSVGGSAPRAEIVVRVPVDDLGEAMADIAALGEEVSRTADTADVEATLVDLESRTATQRAGVERIRQLLGEAQGLDDVLALEAELTRRQADLESVAAQREALADRAALATVTVLLTRPADVEAATTPAPPFLGGLRDGWAALLASTRVLLVAVGALLPFAVAAAVVAAVVLGSVRVARSRHHGTESTT